MTELARGAPAAPTGPATPLAPRQVRAPAARLGGWRWLVGLVVVLAVALGLALRLWYLFHLPVNSDESVVGLMARSILHGHFTAFYWGQAYGGGEPYVVALMFFLFGQGALTLKLTSVVLSALSAVLTWRVARRTARTPGLAPLAGALVWVASDALALNSAKEYGFRSATMVCGLLALLFALRILDRSTAWPNFAVLGLALGAGWWSSPEIAYFAVPAALVLLGALVTRRVRLARALIGLAVGVVSIAVGALPWLWANVRSHWASLNQSSFPGGASSKLNSGFGGRLSLFFHRSLPIDVDVRRLLTGGEVFGGTAGTTVTVAVEAVIIVSILWCLVRHDRASAFAVALLAFPLIFAAQPGTWFWQDGRYVVFLSPLIALVLAGAADAVSPSWWRPAQALRRRLPVVVLAVVVAAVGVLTSFAFARDNSLTVSSYDRNWKDPNGPVDQAIGVLERHGVRDGYANYWVAYKVDLLSRGGLTITPARGDIVRSSAVMDEVDRSSQRAWLFVPPSRLPQGYQQFSPTSFIVGPRAVTEAQFTFILRLWHIGYRTVSAGLLVAVIPDRPITYADFKAVVG